VFHHHIVAIMQQLIAAIKEKGPGAAVDMADVGQRESFDTIGARARRPAQRSWRPAP